MDKNRTIIVIISIIILVAAVSSVALWLFYPRPQTIASTPGTTTQFVLGGSATPEPNLTASASPSSAALGSPAPSPVGNVMNQQVLIVDGSTNDYHVGADGKLQRNDAIKSSASPAPLASPASGLVVSGGSSNTAVPATSKPRASGNPSGSHVSPAPKLPSPAPVLVPAKHGNEFWIQVIASTNKDRVEQIKKELGSLGFNGRMSAFSKSGTDFYRLRYGPYFEKAEAQKFLVWVKVIKGLENSYVVEEKTGTVKPAPKK